MNQGVDVTYELRQYIPRQRELRRLEELIREIKYELESPRVTSTVQAQRGSSDHFFRTEEQLDKLGELYRMYSAQRDRIIGSRKAIEYALSELSPTDRDILRMRYIQGKSWIAVAVGVEMSDRSAQRHCYEAMRALGEAERSARGSATRWAQQTP